MRHSNRWSKQCNYQCLDDILIDNELITPKPNRQGNIGDFKPKSGY